LTYRVVYVDIGIISQWRKRLENCARARTNGNTKHLLNASGQLKETLKFNYGMSVIQQLCEGALYVFVLNSELPL